MKKKKASIFLIIFVVFLVAIIFMRMFFIKVNYQYYYSKNKEYDLRINSINEMKELKWLKNAEKLEVFMGLEDYDLLSVLKTLPNIKDITIIWHTNRDGWEQLVELTSVSRLELETVNVRNADMEYIGQMDGLTELYILSCPISKIADIVQNTNITSLGICPAHHIVDIDLLSKMTSLKSLYLDYSKMQNINFIDGLSNLEYLSIYNAEIDDISIVYELESIQTIHITDGQLPQDDLQKLIDHGIEIDYSEEHFCPNVYLPPPDDDS